ncbi:MAG TPA: AMP-binding protein [Acidimicrobiales bacterium]|nr:AMP-binding protein [Acidimicrobiales bacterium]
MATSAEIQSVVEGQTVPTAFVSTSEELADSVALRWRNEDGSWGEWTFRDYAERVAAAAAGLAELGVGRGSRVVLMLRNIPEFHVLDMATYFCGGTAVSIYNSSSPDQIQYLAGHCEALVGIAEDIGFLESFLKVREELPALQHLGVLRDPEGLAPDDVFTYDQLLERADPVDLSAAASTAQPDDLATIIYTSGTTGPPKGVMISHRNIAWTVESLRRSIDFETYAGKRLVSYLPMAHIAERMTSHYQQAFLGYEVTTCPNPADIAAYAREVRPQLMFGVPRVWEKLHAGVMGALAADPEKKAGFEKAVEAAKPIVQAIDWDEATDEQRATYEQLDAGAFANVRAMLGLDAVEVAITGAAPIPAELLMWFRAIGVPLSEIYGMSESSGPMTWTATRIKAGTVGPAIPGCEVKLAEEDDEIICRGGNVFGGYLNDPEKTAETVDEDGWLHSGDIGKLDEDGYFSIVDRKKELIVTAGGKNVSPANLEAALKMIPLVGQACAVGDRKPFVAALVVLDPDTAPAWARSQGIEFDSLADLATNDDVKAEVERGLAEVMAPFNNAERVKKVTILGEEWLPDSEELTPTSKLKRRGVHTKYAEEIEALYG